MLIDVAVLSYYHTLRINGWVGNLATEIAPERYKLVFMDSGVIRQDSAAHRDRIQTRRFTLERGIVAADEFQDLPVEIEIANRDDVDQ